jgi:hypothetical protein
MDESLFYWVNNWAISRSQYNSIQTSEMEVHYANMHIQHLCLYRGTFLSSREFV